MAARKMNFRALLAVAGLTIAAATCPDGETVTKYPGYDVQVGSNLRRVPGLKVGACHSLCVKTAGCLSAVVFTYRSAEPVCFLKSASVDARVRPSSTASMETLMQRYVLIGCAPDGGDPPVVPPADCPDGTTYGRFPGFDVDIRNNLGQKSGLTEGQCRAFCDATSGCQSTVLQSFPRGPDKCFLKTASVDTRVPVSEDLVSMGCAGPTKPVCDSTTCVARYKRCGGGAIEPTLDCCESGFSCYALSGSDYAQCRHVSDVPPRFLPDPVDCGTYGDLGTLGAYA